MRSLLLIMIAGWGGFCLQAQDIHFSQFNASALTLNPALAGKIPCTYRGVVNYRNQWSSIADPYITFTAAFDYLLSVGKPVEGKGLGIGAILIHDRAGDGAIIETGIGLFTAWHQPLNIGVTTLMSVGLHGNFYREIIDYSKLIFPNSNLRSEEHTSELQSQSNLVCRLLI